MVSCKEVCHSLNQVSYHSKELILSDRVVDVQYMETLTCMQNETFNGLTSNPII